MRPAQVIPCRGGNQLQLQETLRIKGSVELCVMAGAVDIGRASSHIIIIFKAEKSRPK